MTLTQLFMEELDREGPREGARVQTVPAIDGPSADDPSFA